MILVSFFSEDNVLSDEIKIGYIFEYQILKNQAFRLFWDTRYNILTNIHNYTWYSTRALSHKSCVMILCLKLKTTPASSLPLFVGEAPTVNKFNTRLKTYLFIINTFHKFLQIIFSMFQIHECQESSLIHRAIAPSFFKTLFNIVEAPFKTILNFDVCVVWWCSDGPINS